MPKIVYSVIQSKQYNSDLVHCHLKHLPFKVFKATASNTHYRCHLAHKLMSGKINYGHNTLL